MAGPRVVLLGAGHGRRMGGPKVLTRHGGRTFLERILARCAESASPVTLTVDPRFRVEVEALLETCAPPKPTLAETDGTRPMLDSVQAPLAAAQMGSQTAAQTDAAPAAQAQVAAPWAGGFWLWPVDAPFISPEGWARARKAAAGEPDAVWKLRAGGKTGHPIWFPAWSVPRILAGAWADGLLGFLAEFSERIRILPLEEELLADFNTPERLAEVPPGR